MHTHGAIVRPTFTTSAVQIFPPAVCQTMSKSGFRVSVCARPPAVCQTMSVLAHLQFVKPCDRVQGLRVQGFLSVLGLQYMGLFRHIHAHKSWGSPRLLFVGLRCRAWSPTSAWCATRALHQVLTCVKLHQPFHVCLLCGSHSLAVHIDPDLAFPLYTFVVQWQGVGPSQRQVQPGLSSRAVAHVSGPAARTTQQSDAW